MRPPQPTTSLGRRAASIASALALWAHPKSALQLGAANRPANGAAHAATPVEEIRKAASVLPGYGPPGVTDGEKGCVSPCG